MKHRRTTFVLCGLVTVIAAIASCSGGGEGAPTAPAEQPAAISKVVIAGAPALAAFITGDSVALSATARDAAGRTLANRTIQWASSDLTVATVTGGVVRALGAGTVTITASAEGRSAAVSLAVRARIATPQAGSTQPAVTSVFGGRVSVSVPATAMTTATQLHVGTAGGSAPASNELLPNTAFSFGPDGIRFSDSLTLSIRFDSALMAPRVRAGLAVYLASNGDWVEVPGSVVFSDIVTAKVTHFSTYAILRRAPAATVTVTEGDNQSAAAGARVPSSPAVRVTDARGRTLPLVDVVFAITSGGGTVAGANTTTDAAGLARAGGWTLGAALGAQTLSATVAGLPPVTFSATATQRAVASLVKIAGDGQGGSANSPVAIKPAVRALGSDGQPVSGASVTFSATAGSGQVSGPQQFTDASGEATVGDWILGSSSSQQLTASAGGASVVFHATVALPASALRIVSAPSRVIRGAVIQGIVVEMVDQNGARVPTATARITPSVDSGPPALTNAPPVTATNGVATFSGMQLFANWVVPLKFSAPGVTPIIHYIEVHETTSSAILAQGPASAVDGELLSPQPVIEFRMGAGGIATYDTGTVTASMRITNGRLSGITTVKAVNGVARFTDLRLSGSGWQRIELDVRSSVNARASTVSGTPYFRMTSSQPDPVVTAIEVRPRALRSGWTGLLYVARWDKDGFLVPFGPTSATVVQDSGTAQLKSSSFDTHTGDMSLVVSGHDGEVIRLRFSSPGIPDAVVRVPVYQTPDAVVFRQQPVGGRSGQPLSVQPIVDAFDRAGLPYKPVAGALTNIRSTGNTLTGNGTGYDTSLVNGSRIYTDLRATGPGPSLLVFSLEGGWGPWYSQPFTTTP